MLFLSLMTGVNTAWADALDDLIYSADSTHPSIASKNMLKKSAESDLKAAKLSFLPSVGISTEPLTKAFGGGDSGSKSYGSISLTQPIFGGGIYSNYKIAKEKLNIAQWAVLEQKNAIALQVVNAYVAWFNASKKFEAAKENVGLYENFTRMMKNRVAAGVSAENDSTLSSARLSQAQSDLAGYQAAEYQALINLNQLVGKNLNRNDLLGKALLATIVPDEVIQRVLSVSPTLKKLEASVTLAEKEADYVMSQAYPQVSLQAKRLFADSVVNGASPNSISLIVSYSSGNGFSSLAKGSAANSRIDAAKLDIESAKKDIVVRVNQEITDYKFAQIRNSSLKLNSNLTRSISESYGRLYIVGKKSWLDLMNAVREGMQTKLNLADVESTLLGSARRLKVYTKDWSDDKSLGFNIPEKMPASKKNDEERYLPPANSEKNVADSRKKNVEQNAKNINPQEVKTEKKYLQDPLPASSNNNIVNKNIESNNTESPDAAAVTNSKNTEPVKNIKSPLKVGGVTIYVGN